MEGGRKPLSKTGQKYAQRLRELVMAEVHSPDGLNFGAVDQPITAWASPNAHSKDIAAYFASQGTVVEINALADMNPGLLANMTAEEIQAKYPTEFAEHAEDVYNYRYPRAESFRDVAFRLEPIILEMERGRGHILVIAQKPILQCLYSYFTDLPETVCLPSVSFYPLLSLCPACAPANRASLSSLAAVNPLC